MATRWDVVVVGAGPGGALTAKRCAEGGLRTLLVEKKKLPRDKCCSGMVMGSWGQDIVREEFGEYPKDVARETTHLLGYAFHVPGAPVQMLDVNTPATWRKNLDTWMCTKAREAGAEVWDSARVRGVTEEGGQCIVAMDRDGRGMELESEFVVGADGADSPVRKALFPDLKPTYVYGYRECYPVRLDLPEKRFHVFSIPGSGLLFFTHEKGDSLLLEGVTLHGRLKETIAHARRFLIDHHGLDPDEPPLWRDGCVQAVLYPELAKGMFRPARGNTLLVGDAAGLNVPVTGEGLATSLKSGLEAARAIMEARESNQLVESVYLRATDELLTRFHDIHSFGRRIRTAEKEGDPRAISDALVTSWDYALKLF